MKISAFALVVLLGTTAFAHEPETPKKADPAAFAYLKTLIGTWTSDGPNKTTYTYSEVSGGRCIKEHMDFGKGAGMDTVYCADGEGVVATHYCDSGNQPRLKSKPFTAGDKALSLDFLDATGLASPNEGHMHALVVEKFAADKATLTWSFFKDGKEQQKAVFNLVKKKG